MKSNEYFTGLRLEVKGVWDAAFDLVPAGPILDLWRC